jgi:uncharacterized membrane protein YvbJ
MRTCPNCGAEVPDRARACPDCGSDEHTGWAEQDAAGGLGLLQDDFDYEEFVRREFGGRNPVPRGIRWFWWVVAVLVLALFLFFYLRPFA